MQRVYETYFPFYEDSWRTSVLTVSFSINRIFFPEEVAQSEMTRWIARQLEVANFGALFGMLNDFPNIINFHKIQPNNVYLPILSRNQASLLYALLMMTSSEDYVDFKKSFRILGDKIDGNVSLYDYDSIAGDITILNLPTEEDQHEGEDLEATYVSHSGIERTVIKTNRYLNEALSSDETYLVKEPKTNMDSETLEDNVDISKIVQEARSQGIKSEPYTSSESNTEKILTAILSGDQKGKKSVPCLVGLSGVAKSAIIKKVARKMGYRMVDFRAAFLHRLDMEGMSYMVDKDDNILNYDSAKEVDKFTKQAFLGDFVKVSDQYMEYASRMASRLEDIKTAQEGDDLYDEKQELIEDDKLDQIDKYILKFKEEAKPAVLFFDEIIRAKLKILSLFTILLDTKKFATLTFYKSKICAAANTPHGMENLEEGLELFVKQELEEPATFNRLSIIPVTPGDMYSSWIQFAKDSKWDPIIIDFVSIDPNNAYDVQFLDRQDLQFLLVFP